jgi:Ca2+/H+ antiporter
MPKQILVDGVLQLVNDTSIASTSSPDDDNLKGLLILSRGTAIILLCVYVAYLYFQVRKDSLRPYVWVLSFHLRAKSDS